MQRMVEPSSVCLCSEIQIYNLLRLKIEPNPIRIELDAVDVGIMHVHSNFPHTELFIPFASRVQMHVFRFVHKYSWLKHIYTSLDMYPICNEILIPRACFIYSCRRTSATKFIFVHSVCMKTALASLLFS